MAGISLTRRCTTICGQGILLQKKGWLSLRPATAAAAFSTSHRQGKDYKLVIVGGGAGGSAIANKFTSKLGNGAVAVVEPSDNHYYQPLWTLVGGGLKTFEQTRRSTRDILPKGCDWIKDKAASFDPENNTVTTEGGEKLHYKYLVVCMGVNLDYHLIKGLPEALESDPNVVSVYSPKYVTKTFPAIQGLSEGQAVFTFPNKPIKCAGAPQKILYLTDDYLRRAGKRDKVKLVYNTSLPVIFGIPKYAEALMELVKRRDINVNFRHNLIEVDTDKKEAIFELLDNPGETVSFKYSVLHAAPPCSPPEVLKTSPLVDETGFVELNKETLQHTRYPNVFGIGDCTNLPTAKTGAAVAAQSSALERTLKLYMQDKPSDSKYNGYTSCPLVTRKGGCIMAEFGYDGKVLETFPVNQAKERKTMYYVKAEVLPRLYWWGLVKGIWGGPGGVRKILSLGTAK